MITREQISQSVKEHFDQFWNSHACWDFDNDFERAKYGRQIKLIADRRYPRVLELGCGAGHFTRLLASHADRLLALDVAPAAIERGRALGLPNVEFCAQDIMTFDLHTQGPWDLIVMSETICSLGWLYPFFDVGFLACDLLAATSVGGRFLMANTFGPERRDYLSRPWLVHTYRDLFLNVGYDLEQEETYRGTKEKTDVTCLLSLYNKSKPSTPPDEMGPLNPRGQERKPVAS